MITDKLNPASAAARTGSGDAICLLSSSAAEVQTNRPPRPNTQDIFRARLRRERLVSHLHRLGPAPLGHFLREVEVATGADVTARLERYAEIGPEFVRALGGDRFAPYPSLRCNEGAAP